MLIHCKAIFRWLILHHSNFSIICNFLPNPGRILPVLTFNGCDTIGVKFNYTVQQNLFTFNCVTNTQMKIENEGLYGNVHMLWIVDDWTLIFYKIISVSLNLKKLFFMLTYFQIQDSREK